MTVLQKGKLYEIDGWSKMPAGMVPTITFIGITGTLSQYGSNSKPSSLTEMATETADDITDNKNFKVYGLVKYYALGNTGTATIIESGPFLTFKEVGDIA